MAGTFPNAWQEVCFITIQIKGGTARQFAAITETIELSEPEYTGESINNCAGGRIWKQTPGGDGEVTMEIYPIELDDVDNSGLANYYGGIGQQTVNISAIDGDATTITVDTATAHNLLAGDVLDITGTTNYNGRYKVNTVTDADTFTISDTGHNVASEATGKVRSFDVLDPINSRTDYFASINKDRDTFIVALMWTDDSAQTSAMSATTSTDKTAIRFYAKDCRIVSHKSSFADKILKTTVTFKFPDMNQAGSTKLWAWGSTDDTDTSPLTALTYT